MQDRMHARDWFMVGARLFGLWFVYQAIVQFMHALESVVIRPAMATPYSNDLSPMTVIYFLYGCAFLFMAAYLFFGTRHLASLCYGPELPETPLASPDDYYGDEDDYPEDEEEERSDEAQEDAEFERPTP